MVSLLNNLALLSAVFAAGTSLAQQIGDVVPGKYIITLNPEAQMDVHLRWASNVHERSPQRRDADTGITHEYSIRDFQAYAGAFDDSTIEQIRNSEDVAHVEQSTVWGIFGTQTLTTQENATWGLGAISHRSPVPSTSYIYDDSGAGKDTYAYILDTGLYTTHEEFEGRASFVYNAVPGSNTSDNVGHGTHVAGTIGARTYGVAKEARLWSVKVLDSELGLDSTTLAGFDWAVKNITAEGRQNNSVINMSLGGGYSQAFNAMIEAAYQLGIISVVASGNFGGLANTTSPASAPSALTVGAIDQNFTKPTWSDYGSSVDLFAPGVDVLSTFPGEGATEVLSGTSMAAPHVAGLVLYLKSLGEGASDVDGTVKELATRGEVKAAGEGSPNMVAYNGNGA